GPSIFCEQPGPPALNSQRPLYSLFIVHYEVLFVGIDDEDGQQTCGFGVAVICADEMMIARYLGPALAGAIHPFRAVIDFATNCTLQDRCIDESRFWMGMRGI